MGSVHSELHVSGSLTEQLRRPAGLGRKLVCSGFEKGHPQSQGIRLMLRRDPTLGDTKKLAEHMARKKAGSVDGGSAREHIRLWGIISVLCSA